MSFHNDMKNTLNNTINWLLHVVEKTLTKSDRKIVKNWGKIDTSNNTKSLKSENEIEVMT